MGAADHKTSGRIDKELCFLIDQLCRQNGIKYIFLNILMDLFLCHILIVLRRQYNRLQASGSAILVILYGNLCFSIGTQVLQRAVLAYIRELECQLVSQRDRIRHIFLRLIGCIAKHHSLISGSGIKVVCQITLLCLQRLIDTHCNIS